MKPSRPILLVEDDYVDYLTVKRALKETGVSVRQERVKNGEEALTYLNTPEKDQPGIIVLDLNMPRMNGIEFLKTVKHDPNTKKIPVVILTTSKAERDIEASFALGAAGYIVKPVDYRAFTEAVITIERYWRLSELPA